MTTGRKRADIIVMRGASVQITTITLTKMRLMHFIVVASLMLAMVSACDRVATVIAQVDAQPQSQTVTVASITGRVVGVTDGDTLKMLDAQNQQHTIRLAEIDAPERGQPWGNRSKQTLSALTFGKTVSVQQTDTDRYGRVVGRVFADGEDVNRAMVEQGAAWAYRQYLTDQTLIATEARARRERAGLWSMSDAQTVAPWDWRKGVRRGGAAQADEVLSHPSVQPLLSPRPSSGRSEASVSEPFSCSGKRYCREMNSCAEANFYLRQCGVSSLDGNSDGEPCEMLCGTARDVTP